MPSCLTVTHNVLCRHVLNSRPSVAKINTVKFPPAKLNNPKSFVKREQLIFQKHLFCQLFYVKFDFRFCLVTKTNETPGLDDNLCYLTLDSR